MHRRFPYRSARLLVVGFLISLSACAAQTARINQFDKFAQAGSKFADAVPPVLDEAFVTAVKTDSLVLLQARAGLSSQDDRLNAIDESTKSLSQQIAILSDLKRQASLLRAARLSMMSAGWMLALEKKDAATRTSAAKALLRVQHAILKLENEQLGDIRDKLLKNDATLATGANELNGALQNLQQVQSVLKAVSGLLVVVGRIVAIMA